MAFIDFSDNLMANGDLAVVQDMQSKIRNLLEYRFAEAPQVYFDVSTLLIPGLDPGMVSQIIMDHLSDYGVPATGYQAQMDFKTGALRILLQDSSVARGDWLDE